MEGLTNRLEEEAGRYFAEIERRGGVVSATEQGWIQREIHRSAYAYQRALEHGRKKMVGINCYNEEQGKVPAIELHRIDPSVEKEQVEGLRRLRAGRDAAKARRALDDVRDAAKGSDNLLQRFIAAAHADCTIGEIAEVLRECWGEYKEPRIL